VIVIDTSAVVAVINHESERPVFLAIIAATDQCLISTVTMLENRIVTFTRFSVAGIARLEQWLGSFAPLIVAFDENQTDLAFVAFKTYGKGTHARAKLNFGDCASYALAKSRNLPHSFKGNDFSATDIQTAV
jgi:ribonuclease VapC